MSIHENSRKAYEELMASGALDTWRWKVWGLYKSYGDYGLTDRQVYRILGLEDSKSTQPSCSDLFKTGEIIQVGYRECEETEKTVRICIAGPWYDKKAGVKPPPKFSLQRRTPPVPGHYWYGAFKGDTARVVTVFMITEDGEVWFTDSGTNHSTTTGWWSLPIFAPAYYGPDNPVSGQNDAPTS